MRFAPGSILQPSISTTSTLRADQQPCQNGLVVAQAAETQTRLERFTNRKTAGRAGSSVGASAAVHKRHDSPNNQEQKPDSTQRVRTE